MDNWHGNCHRCGTATNIHTMSMFNTELICMDCKEKEKEHPKYKDAQDADWEAIREGNRNFPGIGKPEDL